MHTNTTYPSPEGADPEELDRHIASMYRDVGNETSRDLHFPIGMDVFAAPAQVGPAGFVTGVDITPEQLTKAERLSRDGHVSFHRARIEEFPFDNDSFGAVISNGVVNLRADKRRVFAEAARVLRPGGRLALSDIVTDRQIASAREPQGRRSERLAARAQAAAFRDISDPDPGDGAGVAQATRAEVPTNITTTQEVTP